MKRKPNSQLGIEPVAGSWIWMVVKLLLWPMVHTSSALKYMAFHSTRMRYTRIVYIGIYCMRGKLGINFLFDLKSFSHEKVL